MKLLSTIAIAALLAGCSKSASEPPPGVLLEPLPGTGQVEIEMRGIWRIAAVEILEEFTPPEPNPIPTFMPFGLVRPVIDDLISIDERGFTMGAGRPLLREVCEAGFNVVGEYYNQIVGSIGLYNMHCYSRPDPNIADGGGLHLRMAFGAVAQDALLGLIDFRAYGFLPSGTPTSGTYRVALERMF